MNLKKICLLAFVVLLTGCAQGEQPASESPGHTEAVETPADMQEATSLFGETLYRLRFSPERQAELEANLAEAQAHFDEDPDNIDNIIWLRRLGRHPEADDAIASVHAGMELLENFAYHRRLLMYKGEIPPDSLLHVEDEDDIALTLATQGYGVGNFHFVNDERERAEEIFRQVVAGTYWPAFGYIAAEADLKRLGQE